MRRMRTPACSSTPAIGLGLRTVTVIAGASNFSSTARAMRSPSASTSLCSLVRGDVFHHLEDALVVERVADAVAAAGGAQVVLDLDVEQHRAAHAPLGRGDAERSGYLDAFEEDGVGHG